MKCKPSINTTQLTVIPCALGTDENALKPEINYDQRMKNNVELDFKIDLEFVTRNLTPKWEWLKKLIVNEVLVSSETTLGNKCSLLFAADYVPNKAKTGVNMTNLFDKQIRLLQICKECLKTVRTGNHITEFHETFVSVYVVIAFKSNMFAKNVQMMDKFLPTHLSEHVGHV